MYWPTFGSSKIWQILWYSTFHSKFHFYGWNPRFRPCFPHRNNYRALHLSEYEGQSVSQGISVVGCEIWIESSSLIVTPLIVLKSQMWHYAVGEIITNTCLYLSNSQKILNVVFTFTWKGDSVGFLNRNWIEYQLKVIFGSKGDSVGQGQNLAWPCSTGKLIDLLCVKAKTLSSPSKEAMTQGLDTSLLW